MNNLSILIIDDEKYIREELQETLENYQFRVATAKKPSTAFSILRKHEIDIVILDIDLPEMDGLTALKKIKNDFSDCEVIMITAQNDINYVITALRNGAADFFLKPFSISEVLVAIKKTERYKKLNEELNCAVLNNKILTEELRESTKMVGSSPAIIQVFSLMKQVAKHPQTNVLVTGENGTGKELVSRGIHNLSEKKNEICYAINCAAIPEQLFDSELFGHVKGAFTGAISNKIGCFELTKDGTLILDEITEIPLNLQAKLLRVLEDKTISKIGSHRKIRLNSRIIATSNRNLEEYVNQGKFREDLFHRLNSFRISVPPLRERKSDLQQLAQHYAKTLSKKLKINQPEIDKSGLELLKKYDFPGNVRELRNILERVLIINNKNKLSAEDFSFLGIDDSMIDYEREDFNLNSNEKRIILKALRKVNGNKLQAAKLLGISWQALDRRIKKYNIKISFKQDCAVEA